MSAPSERTPAMRASASETLAGRGLASWGALGASGKVVVGALGLFAITPGAVWLPFTWRAVGIGAAIAAVAWAALIDLNERRLPNRLTLFAAGYVAATVLAVAAVEGATTGADLALSVLAGAGAFAAPILLVHLASPAGMGFGDVKAAAALGAAIGLIDAWSALVALFAASGVTGIAGVVAGRRHVPFGPGLVIGSALALVIARIRGLAPPA